MAYIYHYNSVPKPDDGLPIATPAEPSPTSPALGGEIEVHTSSEVQYSCGMCVRKEKAAKFCLECATPLCEECIRQHSRMRLFAGHSLVNLESQLQPQICEVCSSGAKAEQFCNKCNSPVCKSCADQHKLMRVFRSHTLTALKKAS